MEHKSTIIFFVHALFLSYQPVKVYRIDMDHLVSVINKNNYEINIGQKYFRLVLKFPAIKMIVYTYEC